MGFFDNMGMSKEEWEKQQIKKLFEEKYIFKGAEFEVILPEKQLKISGSSGAKKGVATLAFGIIGWAATSGTSQNEENRIIKTIMQAVDKGVVFKNGAIDGSDIRIPYDNILSAESLEDDKQNSMVVLTLLGNKKIFCIPSVVPSKGKYVVNHCVDVLNKRISGALYEEDGWGLEIDFNQIKELDAERKAYNLERLGEMCENGQITKEKYEKLKEILMKEPDFKSCRNCGAELDEDSNFCDTCGTKVE